MLKYAVGATVAIVSALFIASVFGPSTDAGLTDAEEAHCEGAAIALENEGEHPEDWDDDGLIEWWIEFGGDGSAAGSELAAPVGIVGTAIQIMGMPPIITVNGTVDGEGNIIAFGEGTYAGFQTGVQFNGQLQTDGDGFPQQLDGTYIVGGNEELPGEFPITYGLMCTFPPPSTPAPGIFSITVLKLNDDTNGPMPGWGMELFDTPDCSGDPIDSGFTNDDGIIDFIGLPEGVFSVLEQDDPSFEPDDGNLCREDIAVPATSDTAALPQGASEFVDCPIADLDFPAAGCDEFESGAQVNVEFVGGGDKFTVTLSGPTTIVRNTAPQDVTSAAAMGFSVPSGSDGNGLDEIETEMIQLDLTGDSIFGPIVVRESPDRESIGIIEEQENDGDGEMDFPADSFFDIFFEVDISGQGVGTLHNNEPLVMYCVISEIPPELCLYQPPIDDPIELYDEDEVLIALLIHAAHVPLPLNEVFIVFRNVPVPPVWLIWGDVNCQGGIDTLDALAVLRHLVGFSPLATGPNCPAIEDPVNGFPWGDVNCGGNVDSLSALTILLFIVGLSLNQEDGCLPLEEHLEPPPTSTATPTPTPTPTGTPSATGTPTPTLTPTPAAEADIKVVSFGPDGDPPFSIGSGIGPVNGWWPDALTFDEVKHNNGPDPAKVDVWWFVQDAPSLQAGAETNGLTSVLTSYRWHALPGDICTTLAPDLLASNDSNVVPCGEGDVAGVPSLNGDDCLDGQDNDGDTLVDFADPECFFDIDDLHFTIDLAVSSSVDLSRSLSVYCLGDGEFIFQILNEQKPIDAVDPNLNNNEQAGEVTVQCLPPI